jgi:hypothetical protein
MHDIILDQFAHEGRHITYMTKFFNDYNDGRIRSSVAVFRVNIKDKRSWLRKVFDFGHRKKYISQHFIANQVH